MSALSAQPKSSVIADVYPEMVERARSGDRRAADLLVELFAMLATDPGYFGSNGEVPPALLQYIATCLSDWRRRDYRDAETHFYLERPTHRPAKHVKRREMMAVRAYWVLLAKGAGVQNARSWASSYSGLTEDQVRYLVESHPEKDELRTAVQFLVTHHVRKRLLRKPPRKKYQRSR